MDKKTVIHRFNLFNTQNSQYQSMQAKIQQILYYAESRWYGVNQCMHGYSDFSQLFQQFN